MGSVSPKKPTHHKIVALQTFFCPLPPLTLPKGHTFTLEDHHRTATKDIPSRIRDAGIVVTTTAPLTAEFLSPQISPNLKLIAVVASGTDVIDLVACKARGIRVLNSPNCNVDAVAEHALALYFDVRRGIATTMRDLRAGEWPRRGTLINTAYVKGKPPRGCREEIVAIIGYGGVGKRIAEVFTAVGMKPIIAGRKGDSVAREGRVPFDQAVKTATVIVLCCPRTPETLGLLGPKDFEKMRHDAILINVARGGIVDEGVLVTALRDGKLAGAGVDVFDIEPAGPETSLLLRRDTEDLNIVATPHTAWIGQETMLNYQRALQENINDWIQGTMKSERIKA